MEADGASFTPSLCQCSILRVFKATATQIKEKSEQTLELLRIELGTSITEGSAPLLHRSLMHFLDTGVNRFRSSAHNTCRNVQ